MGPGDGTCTIHDIFNIIIITDEIGNIILVVVIVVLPNGPGGGVP